MNCKMLARALICPWSIESVFGVYVVDVQVAFVSFHQQSNEGFGILECAPCFGRG